MALETTEAVVLKMFNWSESSRTIVFLTREFGKLALVDRGGRSLRSRRGRLMPFARMEVTFYASEKETRGYISDAWLSEVFSFERDGTIGRLAYGSAACELLYGILPEEEPQAELFEYLLRYLRLIDTADKHSLPALFVTFVLRTLSRLGYHPSLAYCVVSGQPADEFADVSTGVSFSPERGGIISPACQRPGEYYIGVSFAVLERMIGLQAASLAEAARIAVPFAQATSMIDVLATFLDYQTGMKSRLKSLEFLDKLKKTQLG